MKTLSVLLLLVFIIPGFIFGLDSKKPSEISKKQDVKFAGLTKTLVNLLKTRTPRSFTIGAYEISMENLIDNDVAALFDCDSVINNYLSDAGDEATYEMLSDVIKNTIWERFDGDDGSLFVNILSDTTSEGLYFNFSVFRDRPVTLPIVLNASDSSFSSSFDTTCTVRFEADIDLFINTSIANADSQNQAIQIRINSFLFELSSDSDREGQTDDCDYEYNEKHDFSNYVQKPQRTIPFNIEGKIYCAATRCFTILARSYWYLTPADSGDFIDDEGQCHTLSYEQLEKGKFNWDDEYFSSFSTDLIMIPADEPWDSLTLAEKSAEFFYTVDNLFDDEGLEQISLCCDYWVKEGVTARNKKFILMK